MTVDELVAYCLAKPGATEDYPWGDQELTAKVGGKVFAFIGLTGGTVGLKCGADADAAGHWRDRHPGRITVSAYIGRYGWNAVHLDGVPDDDVLEMVDASYEDVVRRLPRSKRP